MDSVRLSLPRRLLSLAHIQPGEGPCVAWMVLYSAAAAAVMALGLLVSGALFLGGQPPSALAYIFIAASVSDILVFLLYSLAGTRVRPGLLVLITEGLLLTAILALRLLLAGPFGHSFGVLLALFLVADSASMLSAAQFWSRASGVFDARSARRLLGLAAAGGTLSTMGVGIALQTLTPVIGVSNLLILVAAALATCMLCSSSLDRLHRVKRAAEEGGRVAAGDGGSAGSPQGTSSLVGVSLLKDIRAILHSPVLVAIAGFTSLVALLVNAGYYQFFLATQAHFAGNSQEMAVFMGTYQFWAALAAMVVQLFLTVRVLKRLGVFLALLFFPVLVALGSAVALATGGALLAIAVVKAADPALRQTLNQSALTVLYLPAPDGLRQRAKFLLDAIYALSYGLLGVAFLAVQRVPGWSYVTWCWPVLGLIGIWLLLVRWTRPHYLRALAANLTGRRLDPSGATVAALATLQRRRPESASGASRDVLQARLTSELRDYYEIFLCQAALCRAKGLAPLHDTLHASRERALDRIFLLLEGLYPDYPMVSVRQALTAEDDPMRAGAIELLDCLLDRGLKAALLPILESSTAEMLRVAQARFELMGRPMATQLA